MSYLQNTREINAVNGNVMAWLADKQIDKEYQDGIEALRPVCEDCGVPEIKGRAFSKNLGGFVLRSNLTDGICDQCLLKSIYTGEQHGN